MYISHFPTTIYWWNSRCPIEYSWHPCQRLTDHICITLSSVPLHWVCFYPNSILLWLLEHSNIVWIMKYNASRFVLSPECFGFSGSFLLPYTFEDFVLFLWKISLDLWEGLHWICRLLWVQFSSVQLLSCVKLFATPWTAARQASMSITNSRSSPKLMCMLWVVQTFQQC